MPRHELSGLLAQTARLEETKALGERAVELSGGLSPAVTRLATICYLVGDTSRGDQLFDALQQRARASYVPPSYLACVHFARGEVDHALEGLREANRNKAPSLPLVRVMLAGLPLADPRIEALLLELGF